MNTRTNLGQPSWLWVIAAFIVGGILGWLLLGYVLFPVQWTNADPWDLNPAAKQEWVVMTADTYSLDQNLQQARERLRGFTNEEVEQYLRQEFTQRNSEGDAVGAARLQSFAQVYGVDIAAPPAVESTAPPPTQGASMTENTALLFFLLAGLLLLVAVGIFLYMRFRKPTTAVAPVTPAYAGAGSEVAAGAATTAALREEAPSAPPIAQPQSTVRAAVTPGKSLGTFAATYKFGDDNYDTSFTVETARNEFLGECGMGSSEVIGEGKPDKVTAFDVWLFDKTDVRTVTQILMSEWAYHDQATRQKLATKGELVLAEKGKHLRLETATLVVEAEIVDLVYASTPGLPANSHFQKLIVEMVPQQK